MNYTNIVRDARGLAHLAARLASGKRERVVLCRGHFNVIHPGHRRFLEHARSLGTRLVACLLSDEYLSNLQPQRRYFSEEERAAGLASHVDVDQVVVLSELDINDVVDVLRPAVLVLGKEFEDDLAPEVAALTARVREHSGEVVFHSGTVRYSDGDLFEEANTASRENDRLRDFRAACARQGIELSDIAAEMPKKKRLLVVGDTIVDQYVACDALGMSAEAPVIALRELGQHQYVGGAAIVASHIRALGADCVFLSMTGEDQAAQFIGRELGMQGVETHLVADTSRPTTFKIRYMVGNQKLLRVSRLEQTSAPRAVENELCERIEKLAQTCSGIVVSDFVYGTLTARVLAAIVDAGKRHQIPLFGDLQCSSQVGSCLKFKDFSLIAPNEREARIALSDNDSGLEQLAMKLLARTRAQSLVLTLGPSGFIGYDRTGEITRSESFPALESNPVDVTGAGDALLSALAVATVAGWPFMKAAALGACVAALAVSRVGNTPIGKGEVQAFVEQTFSTTRRVTDRRAQVAHG